MKCEKCGFNLNENGICLNCQSLQFNQELVQNNLTNQMVNQTMVQPNINNQMVNQTMVQPNINNQMINPNIVQNNMSNQFMDSNNNITMNDVLGNGYNSTEKKQIDYKKIIIILGFIISFIVIILLTKNLFKKGADEVDTSRISKLKNINNSSSIKFTIKEHDYYVGDKVKKLFDDGYVVDNSSKINNNHVTGDSVVAKTFYYDDEAMFLGFLYCPTEESCTYENTILIKANFYNNSKVLLNDNIKIGTKVDEIKSQLGESIGDFYQDSDYKVWSANGKVGSPYYIFKVSKSNSINEIRIGVWWYDGELAHTAVSEVKNEE